MYDTALPLVPNVLPPDPPSSPTPTEPRAPTDGAAIAEPPIEPRAHAQARRWLGPSRGASLESDPPTGALDLAEALLKAPARVLAALDSPETLARLALLCAGALIVTGIGVASFSYDLQLLVVPLKLTLGTLFCALLCLPSLHVFSCLSGASQSLRQTFGALLMGVALMAILLCGFAPVVWVFAQATTSVALVGALHLGFFLVSAALGLSLTRRALSALNDTPIGATGPWALMFVFVLLQTATTLRPLVGPFDGLVLHDRMFFLEHWVACLSG